MSDIAQRALARNSNNETNVRHYCRNPRCRSKLKVPVENEHHAFCTPGCHTSFYRSRCLVCEDQMRRKSDRQRFGSGHRTCQSEYRRFPHVYELWSRLLPDRSARLSHQRHRWLQIPAGTSMPGWRAMKETSREHRPYRRASDAPLEQAMRDIRAEQELRPEDAGRFADESSHWSKSRSTPGVGRSAQLAITRGWT